ncbi:hypothetical protein AC578_1096 [Pseudocercospora eumusae]|uniref:Major facilitator superfamily (MFS) profile domain-containing protein n=1 Tax=Pseudocercospora eumusae TaxID=321146 RepID=A0A139HTL9_9PEZI|nr:hypothetical protein AC578_1096 [Pseudocercospora eumusae]
MSAQTVGDIAHEKHSFPLEHGVATMDHGYIKQANVDVEAVGERTAEREIYPAPTQEEASTLRKVADKIPKTAWLLCIVEFSERASYYGVKTVFSNFMQFPLPKGGNGAGAPARGTQHTAGALGRGLQFSNAFVLLFAFLAYIIPIFGAWIADTKLGRFKTVVIGVIICGVSHVIMVVGAIPSILQAGNGIAPFMISFFLLAIGAGLFKPNVAPIVLDQYTHQKPYTKTLGGGERVIVDPEVTVQKTMLVFYGFINIGAFFMIATSYSAKYVGFWLAYLLPGIVYFLLPVLLWFLYPRLQKYPPDGSALTKTFRIIGAAFKRSNGKFWKHDTFWLDVMPSHLEARGITTIHGKAISWTDKDVDDVRRTMVACAIFLYYPIYNLNDGGIGSVLTSQGSTLTTNGAPNDLLNNFNPITVIVATPLLSYVIYPALRRAKINFGRISRITFGFLLAMTSSVIGAIIQWRVYKTSPCGYQASECNIGTGVSPILIWVQIPIQILGALSECFCNVTAYELAYARSPDGMKALVVALFLATTALSNALGEIVSPAIKDPYLIWIWAGPAIALALQTVVFWFRYRKFNNDEFMTYEQLSEDLKAASERTVSVAGTEKEAKVKA